MARLVRTIHEIAALVGVAPSTLRYYDEIGLLKPQSRSSAGYRLYGEHELQRLREIVTWRRLGFGLAEIANLVDAPDEERIAALDDQLSLASAHLSRLHAISADLGRAIAAVRQGQPVTSGVTASGTSSSIPETAPRGPDASSANGADVGWSAALTFGSGYALPGYLEDDEPPRRICATDPLRLAEAMLALGIVPVATGTYEDRFTGRRGAWPWSPCVESPVRRRIRDVGHYGSDLERIEASRPDLIIELMWSSIGANLAQLVSDGAHDLDSLSRVAPITLVDGDPGSVPGFTSWLPQVADSLGCRPIADSLLAMWSARVRVLRAHLEGVEVAALSCFGEDLSTPTPSHPGQVLTSVGLVLTPARGRESANGFAVFLEEDALVDLDAPTLFLNTRYLTRREVRGLLTERLAKRISAVRQGRVVDLGMEFICSGWFGAHWQLQLIARAYGLALLRAGEDDEAVLAAVDPHSGVMSVATSRDRGSIVIGGPLLKEQTMEIASGHANTIELDLTGAAHMAQFPEQYAVTQDDGVEVAFTADRESALERVAQRTTRRVRSPRRTVHAPRPARPGRVRQRR